MTTYSINDIDITNDVIANSFNYIARIDDVYGQGSLQFESKTFTENIPPYSILKVNNDYYCCSSEATYHFGRQSWFHNVSIIEITSLLSRFLVGTKVFSNTGTHTYDWEKVDILLAMVRQKYKIIDGWYAPYKDILTGKNEYQFGAGTTLFDALNEIFSRYNYRVSVKYYEPEDNMIYLDLIKVDDTTYIDTSKLNILSMTKLQNAETYCKYLETEATNVIEKDSLVKANYIYPSSNDIKVSQDSMVIKTPTPIYDVEKFEVNVNVTLHVALEYVNFITGTDKYPDEYVTKTYEEWVNEYSVLKSIFNYYFAEWYTWDYFKTTTWQAHGQNLYPTGLTNSDKEIPNGKHKMDLTSHIKSKEQYDLLEDSNKPDYAYYTYGSNVIDGFNVRYKDDFWNTILGNDNKPFIQELKYETNRYENSTYMGFTFKTFYINETINPLKTTFNVHYYGIGNPYIRTEKTDTPLNENKYKNYSISFNKSSNSIDYDKLIIVMNAENNGMGISERIVEYEAPLDHSIQYFGTIRLDDINWYIDTCEVTYNATNKIIKYGVRKYFTNKADSVALNSQYNTLKNPIESIVERPIYAEIDNEFEFSENTYMAMQFKSYANADNNIWSYKAWVKPMLFQRAGANYLYVEMLDQYSVGQFPDEINDEQTKNNVYKKTDVRYVDNNNETYMVAFSFVNIIGDRYDDIRHLPSAPDAWRLFSDELIPYRTMPIYKDAREKLTFTIKLNNCIIK